MIGRMWRFLVGAPLPSEHAHHHRLPKFLALPVFASDALSSTAYASQEIVIPLILAGGLAALGLSLPVSLAIGALLAIVAISYTQTIKSYPKGASCYLVAKDNLGTNFSLIAGAGLLTGYILTVAVSTAAGVEQLTSAVKELAPYKVWLNLVVVTLLTVVNLRGAKESGWFFAIPTYLFIVIMFTLVVVGIAKAFSPGFVPLPYPESMQALGAGGLAGGAGTVLLLRAFSHGCTALTGIEAISDGVGAFQPPEARNAAITLGIMAGLLTTMFLGLSYLCQLYNAVPEIVVNGHEVMVTDSLIVVLAGGVFGKGSLMFYAVTGATMAILFLGANTAYADFPRLSSFLATDRFLPHQLANIGDRLVFSNGILVLSFTSMMLLIAFGGNNHMLLPLYAIGVFMSFTLSQASMVLNWLRSRRPGWRLGIVLNGFGAVCTFCVFGVLAWFRFLEGAWIVVLLIPALVAMFYTINRHYKNVRTQLVLDENVPQPMTHNTVLILVPGLNRGVLQAINYAKGLSKDVRGVHIDTDGLRVTQLEQMWDTYAQGIPLVILESPYRSLVQPTLEYLEEVKLERKDDWVTVVIPEFVPRKWWHTFLHNQSGLMLKIMLMFRRDIVVTNVRYWLR